MFKKKRVIFALVFIFTAGLATGYFVSEFKNHPFHLLINPFSRQDLSRKIFHTENINLSAIDSKKEVEVISIIAKNIDTYEEALELFRIETSYIYDNFLLDLKEVLPKREFKEYQQAVSDKQKLLEKRFKTLTDEAKSDDYR